MDKEINRPTAFLDRDGVLVRDTGYVHRVEDLELLPGVLQALQLLHDQGFLLIVISNQAGVARGKFGIEAVDKFHAALQTRLYQELGFKLDGIYYCPHHPMGEVLEYSMRCSCRKPSTGLLEQAGRDFAIDWDRSIMVGDRESDVECGLKAGIIGIQIESEAYEAHKNPHATVQDLLGAARWTLDNMPV